MEWDLKTSPWQFIRHITQSIPKIRKSGKAVTWYNETHSVAWVSGRKYESVQGWLKFHKDGNQGNNGHTRMGMLYCEKRVRKRCLSQPCYDINADSELMLSVCGVDNMSFWAANTATDGIGVVAGTPKCRHYSCIMTMYTNTMVVLVYYGQYLCATSRFM